MVSLFEAAKEENNITLTENEDLAFKSSLSKVLDLFQDGFSYRRNPEKIRQLVREAALEDSLNTLRCLFYIRDIHEGQGEREVFRAGMRAFLTVCPDYYHVIAYIPEGKDGKPYGRWDDVLALLDISKTIDTYIYDLIYHQLINDNVAHNINKIDKISLLAKWMPSLNTTSLKTRKLAKKVLRGLQSVGSAHIFCSEKSYRKLLSSLRKDIRIIEHNISQKDYSFDYSKIPSLAMLKYKAAFERNDEARFREYNESLHNTLVLHSVSKDEIKINTATLYPYDILRPMIKRVMSFRIKADDTLSLMADNQWRSLKNYFPDDGKQHNWLAVVDTSGSMYDGIGNDISSIDVAVSLGLYIAEHNEGAFKNKMISFNAEPHLIEIDDKWPLTEKLEHILNMPWGYNTNLRSVFNLILNTAKNHNVPAEEMPETIVIISDMQFDGAVYDSGISTYMEAKNDYERAGYKLPQIVFWNACARYNTSKPVTRGENNTILVGGCKPGLFEQILGAKTPEELMVEVLNGERYSIIK